jgi:hypothetical protein
MTAKKDRADFEKRLEEERRIRKEAEDRRRQYSFVMPECCQKMIDTATICLNVPKDFTDGDVTTKPDWYIRTGEPISGYSGQFHGYTTPNFCPFCAAPVPDVEKRVTDRPIMVVKDGGYYCHTCEQRCNCCRCLPGAFHWQPVGSTRVIPELPKYEDEEYEEDEE